MGTIGQLFITVSLIVIVLFAFKCASALKQSRSASGGSTTVSSDSPPANRQSKLDAMLKQLDLVESQLRELGWWLDDAAPPSGYDPTQMYAGLPFEQWLQYEFLPTSRSRITEDALPTSSTVGVMAMRQYDYHSYVEEALPLVRLLQEFDTMVTS